MDESPITACEQRGARAIEAIEQGTAFRHTFTHYHLDIQPIYVQVLHWETCIHENDKVRWHRAGKYDMGLAAPIKKLLDQSSATQLTLPTETL